MVKLKIIHPKGKKRSSSCQKVSESEELNDTQEEQSQGLNKPTEVVMEESNANLNEPSKEVEVGRVLRKRGRDILNEDDLEEEQGEDLNVVDLNAEITKEVDENVGQPPSDNVNPMDDVEEDKPDVEIKPAIVSRRSRRGRKPAATSSQVIEVVKVESSQRDDEIVLRSRPAGVMELFKKLSVDQVNAVKAIGFGSLQLIKLNSFPTEMVRWLCSSFDAENCKLDLPNGQSFQLTAADVHDVFKIPMGATSVPISIKRQHSDLKTNWRKLYGSKSLDISVPLLLNKMLNDKEMQKGNDEFKKCFVMYSMVTLLAPTSNRSADFKLVFALEDTKQIKEYNWCQYVLDDLCDKLANCSATQKYVPGCILLLQICYFHRIQVEGFSVNSSLPLIKHWNDETFRDRLVKENGLYGQGILDEDTYPISDFIAADEPVKKDEKEEKKKEKKKGKKIESVEKVKVGKQKEEKEEEKKKGKKKESVDKKKEENKKDLKEKKRESLISKKKNEEKKEGKKDGDEEKKEKKKQSLKRKNDVDVAEQGVAQQVVKEKQYKRRRFLKKADFYIGHAKEQLAGDENVIQKIIEKYNPSVMAQDENDSENVLKKRRMTVKDSEFEKIVEKYMPSSVQDDLDDQDEDDEDEGFEDVGADDEVEDRASPDAEQNLDAGVVDGAVSASVDAVQNLDIAGSSRVVAFQIPSEIQTNEEICQIANNDVEKNYMFMKRDMKLMSYQFERYIESMKQELKPAKVHSPQPQKEKSPVLSQLDPIYNDQSFWDQIDKIVKQNIEMKKVVDDMPSFKLFACPEPENEPIASQLPVGGFQDFIKDVAAQPISVEEVPCSDDPLGASRERKVVEDIVHSINLEQINENAPHDSEEGRSAAADVQIGVHDSEEGRTVAAVVQEGSGVGVSVDSASNAEVGKTNDKAIVVYSPVVSSQDIVLTSSQGNFGAKSSQDIVLISSQENVEVGSTQDIFQSLESLAMISSQEIASTEINPTEIILDQGVFDGSSHDNIHQSVINQDPPEEVIHLSTKEWIHELRELQRNDINASDKVAPQQETSVKDATSNKQPVDTLKESSDPKKKAPQKKNPEKKNSGKKKKDSTQPKGKKKEKKEKKEVLTCFVAGCTPEESYKILRKFWDDEGRPDGEKNIISDDNAVQSAEFISCDINCGAYGGYKLQLISKFMRLNCKRVSRMRSLRLMVADYCFLQNYSELSDSELLVYFNEFYSLPREEFLTLFQKEMMSSRILDCFFILLNYVEVYKQNNDNPRLFFGGEYMWPLLCCLYNGEGCLYENEVFGAWDMWMESVKCCELFDAVLIFIPIYYGQHYSTVVINFMSETVDYLDNRTYSMQVQVQGKSKKGQAAAKKWKISTNFDEFHTEYYTLTWYIRLYMSKYLVLKGHDNGEAVKNFDIRMIPLDSQKCAVETFDCGVFCLYHSATYEGKPFRCKGLTEALERRRFRAEICASLVLCNLNLRREDVLESLVDFANKNEEIYSEVILNEKIAKANKEAKKASLSKSKKRSLGKKKNVSEGKKLFSEKEVDDAIGIEKEDKTEEDILVAATIAVEKMAEEAKKKKGAIPFKEAAQRRSSRNK